MPRSAATLAEKHFIKGLQTEYTGVNFPVDAATETFNCIYGLFGEVVRRRGFDYETHFTKTTIDRSVSAISTYKWKNAGGSGSTQVFVQQVGGTLHFYGSSSATTASPLSAQKLASTVTLSSFVASGGSFTISKECTYADGNGYLFVFHPDMDPIYCTYVAGTITGNVIDVKVRDLVGVIDSLEDSFRPITLSDAHKYNLYNQGWFPGTAWVGSGTSPADSLVAGVHTWTIQTGLTITVGQILAGTATAFGRPFTFVAAVVNYNSGSGSLQFNITSTTNSSAAALVWTFTLTASASGLVETFFTAAGSKYPSNVDVWWRYKNASDVFDPGTTFSNVSQFAGPAPKGRFILSAFNQNRTAISTVANITTVSTTVRPRIGSWFQGRVWYAGTDASFAATGTAQDTSWSETIYFSQIIEKVDQFGRCYQLNDLTSEDLFDPLPSDGGTIRIQGCGQIFKLFPVLNGMIVFTANGIWFITGSQGLGFTASDNNVVKISGIESCSTTSFVNVQGFPMFWNEEGIYFVSPSKDGSGFQVDNVTLQSIATFYDDIPFMSKKFARGDYNPIDYIVQWVYRSSNESSVTDRYEYDRILCFNVHTKAFYPWSFTGTPHIHDIKYIQNPGGSGAPSPVFKYVTSVFESSAYKFLFSEEFDEDYIDWDTHSGYDYDSYFLTGYEISGEMTKFSQYNYVYIYSRSEDNSAFDICAVWEYATNGNSGRISVPQRITITAGNAKYVSHRRKMRGQGRASQLKFSSVSGEPFFIIGWAKFETVNAGT